MAYSIARVSPYKAISENFFFSVLQEKKIRRVGENQDRAINCRIISATHKDLTGEIKSGNFREDLYYRLSVIPITIPALRDRLEDLLPLANIFLKRFAIEDESKAKTFSKEATEFLLENKWQGNVRELENTVERGVVLSSGSEITLENLIPMTNEQTKQDTTNAKTQSDESLFCLEHPDHLPSLDEVINKYIIYAIDKNGGARDKTAKDIGIDRKTLYRRLQADSAKLIRDN